jgi:maltose alpha-D-glucosyltransferase/alpha-amylase
MYLAYSADPQMRINVGIRRRLAPLVDNNRRRIELLNSVLFSFPGTAILYYGDEIGMGDNIYLGDRNSVRTPMQWSADRNAGFSRANPARLYSPVIMDAVYGYEAVNVEAEQSEPSSLLNWTKHMIALRKLFKVFGRGGITFLKPSNRKVLAYLRTYDGERVLCVANLSRFAQPFELDLSDLAGVTPIEMLGYVEFPKIGRAPYPLTLGPYSFLWFELHGDPEPTQAPHPTVDDLRLTVDASAGWAAAMSPIVREVLESRAIPEFLPRQRWFGGKSKTLQSCRIEDWAPLTHSSGFVLCDVRYAGGGGDVYVLTLALARGDEAARVRDTAPNAVVCPVGSDEGAGILYDAVLSDESCLALFELIGGGERRGHSGVVKGNPSSPIRDTPPPEGGWQVRRLSGEQSNTSVIFGDRFILKLFRRLESGAQPDCEITRYLTEQQDFAGVPPFGGALEYHSTDVPTATLAMVQRLVPNQGDGWRFMQEELGRFQERALTLSAPEALGAQGVDGWLEIADTGLSAHMDELLGISDDAAGALGRRTAELHRALATQTDDAAFSPEPMIHDDLTRLATDTRRSAELVFKQLKDAFPKLPDEQVEIASHVLSMRTKFLSRLDTLPALKSECLKIRIHGDYHLGQVLRTGNDFVIIDFEGEPTRSLALRRAKYSPLRDVAGMLRSFSYAAQVALMSHVARRPGDFDRLVPWAQLWERSVCGMFLRTYLGTVSGTGLIPDDRRELTLLLEAFVLDKVLYELNYELDNRPAWLRVPLAGMVALGDDSE